MVQRDIQLAEIAFARILIPFILGILIGEQMNTSKLTSWILFSTIISLTLLTLVNILYLKIKAYKFKAAIGLATGLTITLTGTLCYHSNKFLFHIDKKKYKHKKYIKITVTDEPIFRKKVWRFRAAESQLMVAIKVQDSASLKIEYGDQLIIPIQSKDITGVLNPAEFDYKTWLARQKIYHQTFLQQAQIIKLHRNLGNRIQAYAFKLRRAQVDFYRKVIKDKDCFSIAATLVLGYRAELAQDTFNVYAKTGTIHVLSVSGMHVGLIYIIIDKILFFMKGRRWLSAFKAIIIITLIWFYALLTGFSPSVLRSAVMLSAFILAKLLKRHSNSYNIISFAAFCLLVYDPFLIWDVGFQLSFLAVLGLIYLQPIIRQCYQVKNKWLDKLWSAIAMSTAAQMATYPLSIYYFHQFPVYFLICNLFIIVPSALLMYLGIFMLIFRIEALAPAFEWLVKFMNTGLGMIAKIPLANITGIWINPTQFFLLSIALFLLIYALKHQLKQLLFVSLLLFLIFQSSLSYQKYQAKHQKLIICFGLPKNYALALISGTKAILITDLDSGQRDFLNHVKPALEQYKIVEIKFKNANKTGLHPSILKKIKASLIPIH